MLTTSAMKVQQLPARKDNYIYILDDPSVDHCIVIDPTESSVVFNYCESVGKKISAIWVTHHHDDHIHGIHELKKRYNCEVHAFAEDRHRIPEVTHPFQDGGTLSYAKTLFSIFFCPGHTLGHVIFYTKPQNLLFCGDVLFSFGCGRLFEGSPEQMLHSLQKLRALPDSTRVHCSHEYTLSNLRFCISLEPQNLALKNCLMEAQDLRAQQQPTVPFSLETQKKLSPFLRWDDSSLRKALQMESASDLEVFTEVRRRRNLF